MRGLLINFWFLIFKYRGHQRVSEEDILRFYRGTHIGNDQIIPTRDNNVRLKKYIPNDFLCLDTLIQTCATSPEKRKKEKHLESQVTFQTWKIIWYIIYKITTVFIC